MAHRGDGLNDIFEKNVLVRETLKASTVEGENVTSGANPGHTHDNTSITGTLTDDSMADALHRHSELSASDGSPNPALSVDTAGNVGIGTTTPAGILHLEGGDLYERKSAANANIVLQTFSTNANNQSILYMDKSSSATLGTTTETVNAEDLGRIIARGVNSSSSLIGAAQVFFEQDGEAGADYVPGRILFLTATDSAAAGTRMTIKSTGRIGIGTSSPDQNLHMHEASSDNCYLEFTNDTTGQTATNGFYVGIASDESARIWNKENTDMYFYTNDTERMRILADGNVGIGTTSPETSAKLDISSTTGALLVPRMTTTQMNALTAVNGMIIYDSTLNKFMFYENGSWVSGSGLT